MIPSRLVLPVIVVFCAMVQNTCASSGNASVEETEVERQNRGVSPCLREHNIQRKNNGNKPPLQSNDALIRAAKAHNDEMINQNCFDHKCDKEPELGDRVTRAGYRWSGVAENIAAGDETCADVMNSWMNSEGHKKNILGNYRDIGCVSGRCPSKCTYKIYWTCVFGTPAGRG